MAVAQHLVELTEKHRLLERKIQEEMARPSADAVVITKLKREKLRIKDELSRLNQTRH